MMGEQTLSVREMQETDIPLIIGYWMEADPSFLEGMGVDLGKLPSKEEWMKMLGQQLEQSYEEKKSYCMIWLVNGEAVGHSNVNKIIYGDEAYMHLHLWNTGERKKGFGVELVKKTLPYFFENLGLKKLLCEPYSLNPAPNKTLEKIGFTFIKQYVTTPGWINFEQPVNRWELSLESYKMLVIGH